MSNPADDEAVGDYLANRPEPDDEFDRDCPTCGEPLVNSRLGYLCRNRRCDG